MSESTLRCGAWCQAATLAERSATLERDPSHRCVRGKRQAERRLRGWRSQSPFSNGSTFARRLEADGLVEQDLLYLLAEPSKSLHRRVSPHGWLDQVYNAYSRPACCAPLPLPETIRSRSTVGFLNLIEPLLHAALEELRGGVEKLVQSEMVQGQSQACVPFNPENVADILFANLPQQLLVMLSRTMVLELNVARMEGWLEGATSEERFQSFLERLRRRDVALALLEEYPVLARRIVVCIENWIRFSLDFLQHLTTDWGRIRSTFAMEGDPGVLVEIRGGAGDTHRGGRSVQIVIFSSGLQLVYKPRSLSVDLHFQELLGWLNTRGDHPPFRTLKILDRGSHGWSEFIDVQGCTSTSEVQRFYERQGAYLALLYALGAVDFHFENLIATGEHPMLLDLETLFHPQEGGQDPRLAPQVANWTVHDSVMKIGLLPQLVWGDREFAGIDVSGLASPEKQLTPQPVLHWIGEGCDEMRVGRDRVEMPGGQNRPTLNGSEVNPLDYREAIESGFAGTYHCLLEHRNDLLSDDGPLAQFGKDEMRVILRPTYVYALLLRESYHPDLLRNALERDRLFDRLWLAVESSPRLAEVTPAEHRDLHHNDVPLFTTRPNSSDLWSSSHERITNFFDEPAMVSVQRHIHKLSEQDCARQLWIIRASLATLAKPAEGTRRRVFRPTEQLAPAGHDSLMLAARKVGDRLENLALKGQGDASYVGLVMAAPDRWALAPLGFDLYDGLPGIALYLAYLGQIAGEERYTTLATAVLAASRHLMQHSQFSDAPIGAFGGWGGVVYCLTHLGVLWRQPNLFSEAEDMVRQLPALIGKDRHFDLMGGAAGCITSLLVLNRYIESERVLAAAVKCGEHLLSHAQTMPHGLGWVSESVASRPLTGFSHGGAGIAWALLELASATGDERFRAAALQAMEYERGLFSAAHKNWPDLRNPENSSADRADTSFATGWCHGAPGIGLGRLLCLSHVEDSRIRPEINVAIETTLERGFGSNHCLCHGDLGNLELLLQASLRLKEPQLRTEAARLAAVVLKDIDQDGWLCGNPLGVESPGLMTGLAGIGYAMLRLAEPDRVPAVLSLDHPPAAIYKPSTIQSDVI